MTPPDQDFLNFHTLCMGHFYRFVGFGLVVDQLSIAVIAVHRHQDATTRVGNSFSARRPAESTINLGMDNAQARAGKHGNWQLRDHGQVEGYAVASLDAAETLEKRSELVYPDVEFLIRNRLGVFRFRLGHPDYSRLVAIGRQVAIDAVVRDVEPTADEPLPKRRVARVQRRVPIVVPGEHIRVFLVALRKVLLTEPFINTRIARICLPNKLWRRLVILLLPPVNGDLCFGDWYSLFFLRHCLITSCVYDNFVYDNFPLLL